MMLAARSRIVLSVLIAAFAVGCDGLIMEPGTSGGGGGSGGGGPGGGGGGGGGGGALEAVPAPTTRFARLTHEQWENTVRDLFLLDAHSGLSDGFRNDPAVNGFIFDNNALSLEVDHALWGGYQRAAAELARTVTSDAALLSRILPPDGGSDEARAEKFIRQFGTRVHRRPLEESEVADYLEVYRAAATLYTGLTPFEAGMRLLLEAFLQSPFFLYRVEQSTEPDGDLIPLDDWEVASRLSYTLWNSMPDEALFAAAAAGELTDPESARAQAERMLDDPRAEDVAQRFHYQLLGVAKMAGISPDATFFPGVSDQLASFAARENELFVRDIFSAGGSYGDVLTSTRTFVNAELAQIYGLEGTYGDEFVAAELDPAERRGVFTQIGYLAANATSVDPDPIHRGVFLAERIVCAHIGVPPGEIPPLPPPEGRTNRETVEDHTEQPGSACASCHSVIINPFGFPFESYDAIGQWRTEDNGWPVDTATEPYIGGEATPVTGALDLAEALAGSDAVHECYVKHWVEYAFGRPEMDEDEPLVERLGQQSLEGASVKSILAALVADRVFLNRSVEELP